jgi:hypothetical protein
MKAQKVNMEKYIGLLFHAPAVPEFMTFKVFD